jgi:membrane-associated phospholipid phosphatase
VQIRRAREERVPAYALAAATVVSRVEARRHFPSDVLAGAALGVASAGIVDALHFGGEEKGEGISHRRAAGGAVGFEVGSDGRLAVALTLQF